MNATDKNIKVHQSKTHKGADQSRKKIIKKVYRA